MIRTLFAAALALVPTLASAADGPPAVGDKAADFTLSGLDGKAVKLHDLTAKGPVVLVVLRGYPGYQCPICTAQVAALTAKADDLGAPVVFVYPGPAGVLSAKAKEFVGSKSMPASFRFLLDPDYMFTKQYNLRWDAKNETAYPSTFVIDGANTIRFAKVSRTHGGRASVKEIMAALGEARGK